MSLFTESTAFLAAAAVLSLAGCESGRARAEAVPAVAPAPAVEVPLVDVESQAVPRYITLTGSLVASREATIASDAAGKVQVAGAERGDVVEAGAVLARLDGRAARLAASEAAARAEMARTQDELAAVECARAEQLFAERSLSRAQYDRATAQCRESRWARSAADARKALAARALEDALVRAPFSGLIVERHVSAGEWVGPGSPVATLMAIDPLRLVLTVPEARVQAIAEGQRVDFELTAFPGERFEATVRYIGPALRERSRDLVVEAVASNPDGKLRPGMFAVARVRTGEVVVPVIPASAVQEISGAPRVYAAIGGRLEARVVQLGLRDGDRVAVLAGLSDGDRIAAHPGPGARDGQRLQ